MCTYGTIMSVLIPTMIGKHHLKLDMPGEFSNKVLQKCLTTTKIGIFKFKLPPKPVPKIDLQEWKDMQKLMYELQRQSMEIKRTQQDISSLKKQLSELRGLFKGKERKSLEGRIELLEDLEKRLHKSLEQIVKREGYPNVQAFQKVYNKAEELIIEYNEELRAWKNQTKQKKEKTLEQPKKASVLEKLHRYQQEGRQQPKRSVKKKSMDRER